MSKTLDALYKDGIRIDLPPRFTGSADAKLIDKALRVLERCNNSWVRSHSFQLILS